MIRIVTNKQKQTNNNNNNDFSRYKSIIFDFLELNFIFVRIGLHWVPVISVGGEVV